MSQAFALLEALRDTLAQIPGVATCRIGLEANMTPADYPMIRIVPSRVAPGALIPFRQVEVLIYFGQPVHEFTAGLEALYSELFELEEALVGRIEGDAVRGQYLETVADEDRVAGYKLMAVRATVQG